MLKVVSLKSSRGQAFDTMMLVIAVIVALAILGVLVSIIGGVSSNEDNSVESQMRISLKQVSASEYGFSEPQKGVVKLGARLSSKGVVGADLPGINPDIVRFCISRDTESGFEDAAVPATPGTPCDLTTGSGATEVGPTGKQTAFWFVVCGDANAGTRGGYKISVSGTAQGASQGCIIPVADTAAEIGPWLFPSPSPTPTPILPPDSIPLGADGLDYN